MGPKILKVLPDVFFVRSTEGVWVRNSTGSFFIKGAQSYDLVRGLFSQMDGTRTLDEVSHGLPPERRSALYDRLVGPLLRNGFLSEVRAPSEPTPAWIEEKYQDHIAFLEHYVEQPVERFLQLRSRRIVCLGLGLLLRAQIVSLAELGFARVRVVAADSDDDAALLGEMVGAAARADERTEWTLEFAPVGSSLRGLFDFSAEPPVDAVLIATDGAGVAEIVEALAGVGEGGPVAGVITSAGGLLLASPLLPDKDWCWECLYRAVVSDTPIAPAPAPAALAAFQLGQRLFCRFAGQPVPEDRRLTSVDCRTLDIRSHTPRRHPGCGRHGDGETRPRRLSFLERDEALVRPDIPTSHDAEESTSAQNSIIESIQTWTDRLTGPFLSVDEEDLAQLPLSASRSRVRAPGSLPLSSLTQTFECQALTPREARNQVVLWALEWLAAETARGGELQDAAFGVGWSMGEAVYRAWAALPLPLPGTARAASGRQVKPGQLAQSATRAFLLKELGDRGLDDISISLDAVSGGRAAATLMNDGGVAGRGVGVDEEQAIDHALTDALARLCPMAARSLRFTAYPAPPGVRWGEVAGRIAAGIAEHWTLLDAGHLLPFLDDRACAVALTPKAARPEGGA